MKVSGSARPGTAKAGRYGQMEPYTKETGKIIKLSVKESSRMLMAMSTMVSGSTIRQTDSEYTVTPMEESTSECGRMIYHMDSVWSLGQIIRIIKVITALVKSMASVFTRGKMGQNIQVNGMKISFQT